MNAVAKQKPGNGMEIFFNPEIDHPQVDMSWCFNKNTLREIIADEVSGWKYHLLVISTHETERGTFEHRQLYRDVRLGFSFFTFYKAGAHDVRAFLFKFRTAEKRGWTEAQKLVAKAGRPGTYQVVIDVDMNDSALSQTAYFPGYELRLIEMYGMDVEIPEEIFADEPPTWLKNWVYLWSKYGPEDQCDFRRRLIFAFTIQLVLFPIWELFKRLMVVLVGIAAFFWGRLSAFKIMSLAFRPQGRYTVPEVEVSDLWDYTHIPKLWRGISGRFLGPIALSIYGFLIYTGSRNQEAVGNASQAYGELVLTIILWLGGIVAIGMTLIFLLARFNKPLRHISEHIANLLSNWFRTWNQDRNEKKRERTRTKAQSAKEQKDALIETRLQEVRPYLACGPAPSFNLATIESRPARKSMRLKFDALKRKVCKPFVN